MELVRNPASSYSQSPLRTTRQNSAIIHFPPLRAGEEGRNGDLWNTFLPSPPPPPAALPLLLEEDLGGAAAELFSWLESSDFLTDTPESPSSELKGRGGMKGLARPPLNMR